MELTVKNLTKNDNKFSCQVMLGSRNIGDFLDNVYVENDKYPQFNKDYVITTLIDRIDNCHLIYNDIDDVILDFVEAKWRQKQLLKKLKALSKTHFKYLYFGEGLLNGKRTYFTFGSVLNMDERNENFYNFLKTNLIDSDIENSKYVIVDEEFLNRFNFEIEKEIKKEPEDYNLFTM